MSMVVPPDIIFDENLVKNLISEQFGLKILSIKLLGEGFDNSVFLVNNTIVFRFPRRKVALDLLDNEINILLALENIFSLNIPKPLYLGKSSPDFNYAFYGHEVISGRSGCGLSLSESEEREAVRVLATFLRTLHDFPWAQHFDKFSRPKKSHHRSNLKQMLTFFEARLKDTKTYYDLSRYDKLFEHIINKAQNYNPKHINYVLVHGDLYHRHLIFDQKHRLSGVIDWGDSSLSDYVADLGVLYQYFTPTVHEDFFTLYGPVDNARKDFARFIALYLAVALLWFGHDRKDQDLIKSSFRTFELLGY